MHVGTDFLKLPPVTGQYWSLFQCSVLGTGGTCVGSVFPDRSVGALHPAVVSNLQPFIGSIASDIGSVFGANLGCARPV